MYSTGIDWDPGSMTCSTVAAAFCDALAKLCRRGPVRHLKQWECGTFAAGDGFANTTPDITCEACRAAIRNDKSAPEGYDPWGKDANDAGMATAKELSDELKGLLAMGEAMQAPCPPSGHSWSIVDICERCGMRRRLEAYRAFGGTEFPAESYTFANCESIVPLPNWNHGRGDILADIKAAMAELRPTLIYGAADTQPTPTPAELYTRFRATVERVVREEAPNARVVTDVTPAIPRERPAQFLVDFEWGQYRRQWSHNFDAPVTQFESSIRQHCEFALREAGARAMGRK